MTELEVLTKVKDILSNYYNWTRGNLARDNRGLSIDPTDPAAATFCLVGACYRVTNRDIDLTHAALKNLTFPTKVAGGIARNAQFFNDTAEHEDVIRCLDKGIANLRK